jgi:hypothetical protein
LPQGRPWRNLWRKVEARVVTNHPKDPQKETRTRRLSAALRDNLKRRKAQARGRNAARSVDESVPSDSPLGTHDSAGFPENNKRNH